MELTVEQITAMAPDPASLSAGKKLAAPKPWSGQGRSDAALWGECQGSAVYQTKVDLSDLAYHCSCPSRKHPCKHVLGLLLLAIETPAAVPAGTAPEWTTSWLDKRADKAKQKQERQEKPAGPVDVEAQAKRAAKREANVRAGIEGLELWMHDLVRGGLAGVEGKPATFWETPAKRLIDAQAPGLAARVRRLAEIPASGSGWPQRLLDDLGRLALLTRASSRFDQLDASLQADVRQMLGYTMPLDELAKVGEGRRDRWTVVAQTIEDEEKLRVQRSWLLGRGSSQAALVLQFAPMRQPFPQTILPGSEFDAELLFYPSSFPTRAHIKERASEPLGCKASPPAFATIEAFLQHAATALSRQPWLDRILCPLAGVRVAPNAAKWVVVDSTGAALPLARRNDLLLALEGSRTVELFSEWDGHVLHPRSLFVDGGLTSLDDGTGGGL